MREVTSGPFLRAFDYARLKLSADICVCVCVRVCVERKGEEEKRGRKLKPVRSIGFASPDDLCAGY